MRKAMETKSGDGDGDGDDHHDGCPCRSGGGKPLLQLSPGLLANRKYNYISSILSIMLHYPNIIIRNICFQAYQIKLNTNNISLVFQLKWMWCVVLTLLLLCPTYTIVASMATAGTSFHLQPDKVLMLDSIGKQGYATTSSDPDVQKMLQFVDTSGLFYYHAMAADTVGNIYVTDPTYHYVIKVDAVTDKIYPFIGNIL